MEIETVKTAKAKPLLTFEIDTREQREFSFTPPLRREFSDGGSVVITLSEGDYGVEVDGKPVSIRIERKSLPDLFGVVGKGRERFECELERLMQYERRYLVIEASASAVKSGFERSLVSGEAALGSVLHWANTFGLIPIFGETRPLARNITQRLLEDFAVHSR